MQTVSIGARRLAYDESGPPSAPAVLLLPWMGGSRLGWTEVAAALSGRSRVIVLDHRDTGDSDPTEDPYTVADLADDAAALLTALHAAPAAVVGLSMGGMVAQHLALRHPDLVRALALVSTTPGGPDSTPATERGRAALFLPAELEAGERARQAMTLMTAPGFTDAHPEALDLAERHARQHPMSTDSYKRQFRAVRAHDATAGLASIQVPTLVLHGDADDLIPLPNAQRLAAGLPGATLRVYPGTGHMPQLERPEDFLTDLRGFLAELG
ncbi:alpha/beta hydrolase [Deinococcus aquiradiocola]|uniref:Hydrolase n=1 Tax=Deinococcus aquiradiocola TaxID=393059 RepID=A0A917UT14_9DEIO|nr:alpha/beta hydrolase [Deinococcus aquiradiocola]GGJ83827.1 hydrolase [Deinococcus aquiradiocola]